MNSYGNNNKYPWRQSTTSQAGKAIYDIRDNLFALSRLYTGLYRTVKQLSADVKDISDMLQERGYISRVEPERKHTLSRRSGSVEQDKVLQDSCTDNEEIRVCKNKGQRRRRMVDIHEQGQKNDGRTPREILALDEIMSRRDVESQPE